MNHEAEDHAEALRSDIDLTRRRMDDTIDSLGERLQPRHLLDEVLGWFRGESGGGDSRMEQVRDKVTRGASQAVNSVVETVKAHPLPTLLIGAGVAWMIYESRREKRPRGADEDIGSDYSGSELQYDPDLHYDRPLEYPPGYHTGDAGADTAGGDSKLGRLKAKAADLKDTARAKMGELGEQTREKFAAMKESTGEKLHAARERAAELGSQVKEKAGAAYSRTRERVASTADEHPLELGLACLAAGVVAGLLLPTPAPVERVAGRTADRLRERARQAGAEALQKGKRVVQAAGDAARTEARNQGLTPEHLRESAQAIAERAGDAAGDTARREGLAAAPEPGHRREENAGNLSGSSDPSTARPVA